MCDGVLPVPVVPSPNFHAYVIVVPSGSLEAPASKATGSGTAPDVGDAVNDATGLVEE